MAIEPSFEKMKSPIKRILQAHLGLAYPGRGSGTTRSDIVKMMIVGSDRFPGPPVTRVEEVETTGLKAAACKWMHPTLLVCLPLLRIFPVIDRSLGSPFHSGIRVIHNRIIYPRNT